MSESRHTWTRWVIYESVMIESCHIWMNRNWVMSHMNPLVMRDYLANHPSPIIKEYGLATISKLLESIGLFGEYRSLLWVSFAKETYNFKEPTNRSHHIKKSLCISKVQTHTAPHCTTPRHTATHRTTLHHTAPHCTTPHYIAIHRTTRNHTTPHRTTLQRTAPHRTTLHHTASHCTT